MKYFSLKIGSTVWRLRGFKARYGDGSTAIELINLEPDLGYEEIYARLTVALDSLPPKGAIWVKTWSENKDLYEALVKEGYLESTDFKINVSWDAEAVACLITEKFEPFISDLRL